MRTLWMVLFAMLFVLLQYKLWFAHDGVLAAYKMQEKVAAQVKQNQALRANNNRIRADVNALKSGHEAIEERARRELGMVKKGEVYYQFAH